MLGKNVALKDNHRSTLKRTLSGLVFGLVPDSLNSPLLEEPSEQSIKLAQAGIGLSEEGFDKLMLALLPTSLIKVSDDIMTKEVIDEIPSIMELYLVHNQNAFTDFEFIGFPFHYWYTAQFLLILFVVLCLIYAVVIDKTNTRFNFVEET